MPTTTMPQPVGHPEKQQIKEDEGNTVNESPSILDVEVVTSDISMQPGLSSTLTSTTPGDIAQVRPSVGPSWSGNGAIDDLCICSPQPTSLPPSSAPVNRKRSASSSLMQHELREGSDDDNNGQPSCPTDDDHNPGPNQDNLGGHGPPGQGPGQNNIGIQPPPAVMQWIQSVLVAIQLVWLATSQMMSLGSWCIRRCKATASDKPCGDEQPANAEPDCQDEKAPIDISEDSKASTTNSQQAEYRREEMLKNTFSFLSKVLQLIGKGPQGPPCH